MFFVVVISLFVTAGTTYEGIFTEWETLKLFFCTDPGPPPPPFCFGHKSTFFFLLFFNTSLIETNLINSSTTEENLFTQVQSRLSSSDGLSSSAGRQDELQAAAIDKSHGANKSVNFAEKTEICQMLSTPQVDKGKGAKVGC